MVNNKKEIALIELGDTHQECLYSQLLFLKKAGYSIHLIISRKLFSNINYSGMWDHIYLHNIKGSISLIKLIKIAFYMKQNRVKTAVFNTAENAVVRNFLFLIPGVICYGILHDISKLNSSLNQKLISRHIRKYIVLNDYLRETVVKNTNLDVSVFYPIFFPEMQDFNKIRKKKGEIWIAVPGQLELKRRDYLGLIDIVEKTKPGNIKFILLGNCSQGDGELIKKTIAEKKLQNAFILFKEYLAENDFHNWIKLADAIMPLIHPAGDRNDYLSQNISGSFNFAFGYKIPMLMHEAFFNLQDFQTSSIFYNMDSLASTLYKLEKKPGQLISITKKINACKKFSFEYQYKNYIKFISSNNA